jgi:hypothetical protein
MISGRSPAREQKPVVQRIVWATAIRNCRARFYLDQGHHLVEGHVADILHPLVMV